MALKTAQFGQLKLVSQISLWFSLVAATGLAGVFLLVGDTDGSYLDAIQSLSVTRRNLPWVMLAGGLLLLLGTGLTTWAITLYSSFRVAGPLYRFSANLEQGMPTTKGIGQVSLTPIRRGDYLQEEWRLLQQTVTTLYDYYEELELEVDSALTALDDGAAGDSQKLDDALCRLRQAMDRAHYDER